MRAIRMWVGWPFVVLGLICLTGGLLESDVMRLVAGAVALAGGIAVLVMVRKRCPSCRAKIGDKTVICKHCGRVIFS